MKKQCDHFVGYEYYGGDIYSGGYITNRYLSEAVNGKIPVTYSCCDWIPFDYCPNCGEEIKVE